MPKRITRRRKRMNKPNYVVYKNGLAEPGNFTRQKDAVLHALNLHDAAPDDLVEVSGYGETGKYFFQEFGQPKE